MADGRKTSAKLIALAALAGVAVGAVAVYVKGGAPGNNPPLASAEPPAVAPGACAARTEAAAQVGDAASGEVAAMFAADPPQPLADIAFNGPDGAPMHLADLSGKTLLVNLWATWCAPCRAEMPALDRLQQEMGGDRFEVVAVNVDTGGDEKPLGFLDEIGVRHLAYYRDDTLGIFNELRRRSLALGLPVTLLVDKEGCLLGVMNGPAEWASEDAKRLVETALAVDEPPA